MEEGGGTEGEDTDTELDLDDFEAAAAAAKEHVDPIHLHDGWLAEHRFTCPEGHRMSLYTSPSASSAEDSSSSSEEVQSSLSSRGVTCTSCGDLIPPGVRFRGCKSCGVRRCIASTSTSTSTSRNSVSGGDAAAAVVNANNCAEVEHLNRCPLQPMEHPLPLFNFSNELSFACGGCGVLVPRGNPFRGCKPCNVRLCIACAVENVQQQRRLLPPEHCLQLPEAGREVEEDARVLAAGAAGEGIGGGNVVHAAQVLGGQDLFRQPMTASVGKEFRDDDGDEDDSYGEDEDDTWLSEVEFSEDEFAGGDDEDSVDDCDDNDAEDDGESTFEDDDEEEEAIGGGALRSEEVKRLDRFVFEASVPLENRFYCPNKERGCNAMYQVNTKEGWKREHCLHATPLLILYFIFYYCYYWCYRSPRRCWTRPGTGGSVVGGSRCGAPSAAWQLARAAKFCSTGRSPATRLRPSTTVAAAATTTATVERTMTMGVEATSRMPVAARTTRASTRRKAATATSDQ